MRKECSVMYLRTFLLIFVIVVASGQQKKCPPKTSSPQKPPLIGLADFHNHQFAYLGFGGTAISHSVNPTDRCLSIPNYDDALRVQDLVRSGLFSEARVQAAKSQCFPTVTNLASQRVDTDNLRRAWEYGLRLIVMMAVSSEYLCKVANLATPCPSDRAAIEQQIQAAKDLEKSIDTSSGGEGRGWYRIAYTPEQATSIIEDGKLAVVLGIEAANAFGCAVVEDTAIPGILPLNVIAIPRPEQAYRLNCADGLINDLEMIALTDPVEYFTKLGSQSGHKALALFEHYWRLGVRHFYVVHNIDGIASGTALSENLLHSEHNPAGFNPLSGSLFDRRDEINRVIKAIRPTFSSTNCARVFPFDGGRCNSKGLSAIGIELVELMAAHGALIDADHLSLKARSKLLADDGPLGGYYPLISSHSGPSNLMPKTADPTNPTKYNNNEGQLTDASIEKIVWTGGSFAPRLPPATKKEDLRTHPENAAVLHECGGTTESFVQAYRYFVDKLKGGKLINGNPAFVGVGIGTDFGPPNPLYAYPRFYKPGLITGEFDIGILIVGSPSGSPGRCYNFNDPKNKPKLRYPFKSTSLLKSTSPLSAGNMVPKSLTPWDGRTDHEGYDISVDGVVHIGMIPDFVEEMRILGLSEAEMQPLWNAAEAYIRTWKVANSWKSSFDRENTIGKRAQCEQSRSVFLQNLDSKNRAGVVAAMREMAALKCRGIP